MLNYQRVRYLSLRYLFSTSTRPTKKWQLQVCGVPRLEFHVAKLPEKPGGFSAELDIPEMGAEMDGSQAMVMTNYRDIPTNYRDIT